MQQSIECLKTELGKQKFPRTRINWGPYLDWDGASKGIKIFKQFPNSDLIPRIPILLSQHIISREIIQNRSSALGRSPRQQLTLWRGIHIWVEHSFEDSRPSFPQSIGHGRMVHPGPQAQWLPGRILGPRGVLERRSESGSNRNEGGIGIHGNLGQFSKWVLIIQKGPAQFSRAVLEMGVDDWKGFLSIFLGSSWNGFFSQKVRFSAK